MVINEPRGEKYKSAQAWGLPCVYPSWILDSVEKGYAVPSAKHLLMPQMKSSTPTKTESQDTPSTFYVVFIIFMCSVYSIRCS